ncbi:MAG TPA: hypothetical protein VKR55_12670, partial [Bradyrhizobium sp.]|uniref:hypothetical protein n=1 Tax=Bradyrhizobium sp. TaxID=376 RepID=UPI002CE3C890
VLNPRRKQAGLIPALAGLEWAIRHEPNRTSIAANAEFLPSLDAQIASPYQKALRVKSSRSAKNISLPFFRTL